MIKRTRAAPYTAKPRGQKLLGKRGRRLIAAARGPVAGLVGIEGGVVSGVINLESPSV
jgi:hypothetical protein